MQAWKVRALATLVDTRTDTAMARDLRRRALSAADAEPSALITLARAVRECALACRAARWAGDCLTSASSPLAVAVPLFTALGWVTGKLAEHPEALEGLTPAEGHDWTANALYVALAADKHCNVPPTVDRDLARGGYTTAELIVTQVHYVAAQVLDLYRRLPAGCAERYGLRQVIGTAEDELADVLAIIEEGVRYGLGMQQAAQVAPDSTAQWAALMGRPS